MLHICYILLRLLEGFPDPTLLDDALMQNLFQQLRVAHELVVKYKTMGKMTRALKSAFLKDEFNKAEAQIGNSVRDLSLAVGIYSAGKISGLARDQADEPGVSFDEIQIDDAAKDDGLMDLADFGDICETVENIDTAVTVFLPTARSQCSAVLFGNKLIVLNYPLVVNPPAELAMKAAWNEECEESEMVSTSKARMQNAFEISGESNTGIVIFHIDNTTSMKNHDRMNLTKKTLHGVIPDFLRRGFRVIMNAWASDPVTKGRIQTKEVNIPVDILNANNDDDGGVGAISKYLEDHVFTILSPQGKTDIYGSFFQLLRQSKDVCLENIEMNQRRPLLLFVLTDGNHNHLDYPMHVPNKPNEDYFGVYAANKNNGTKFGRTEDGFSVSVCEEFLRKEMHSLVSAIGAFGPNKGYQVTCTIIGIGEADTVALSSLATALGNDVSFYGITHVEHIDAVFRNINVADMKNQLQLQILGSKSDEKETISFQYCYEENLDTENEAGRVSACCLISDPSVAQKLHHSSSIVLIYGNSSQFELAVCDKCSPFAVTCDAAAESGKSKELSARMVEYAATTDRERLIYWESLLPVIKAVSSRPYSVTSDSFRRIFSQLLGDRKTISNIRSLLFSRNTRRMRDTVVFASVSFWLKELDDLIEMQITSYRMNVEAELLSALSAGDNGKVEQYSVPSQMVLDRLSHNVCNCLCLSIIVF